MNKQVLLIEDDPHYRLSVKLLFTGEPYEFVEAESPEEGIEKLISNPQIRVILLDLSFGHGEGTLVLDYLKERAGDYKVIVLTAHDELLRAERASEYSVFNYLPKAERSSTQAIRFSIEQALKDLEREHLERKSRYLLEVQKRINDNRPTKETLDLICTSVRSTVGAYTCHIRVYDLRRGDYHLEGFAGPEENLRHVFERPRAKGELFSGRVVESCKPEIFTDLQNMEDFRRFAAKALERQEVVAPEEEHYWKNARSAYIVPIPTGLFENSELVDAVLNVSSELAGFFDAEKRALVDEFVTQAALAVTKDWLQRKRKQVHRDYDQISEMLSEMTDRLKGPDVLRGIYDVVIQRISEIIHPEIISIFLFNEATGFLENVAELRGNERVDTPGEFYSRGQSLTGSVFVSEDTIQLPESGNAKYPLEDERFDHARKEEYLREIPSGDLKHYLGVPIRIGGKVRGVLRVMNKKSKYYDERTGNRDKHCLLERGFGWDCRNVLEITASHLAVAIRNAELLREKDRQVEKVRSLGEVGRLISSELNIEELLSLTIREMAEVMQAEICMLFLKEGEDRIVLKQSFGIPEVTGAFYHIGEGVTGRVAETGEPALIVRADANDGKYDLEIRSFLTKKHGEAREIESLMVVPIVAKSMILGAMKVINKVGDHPEYELGDLDFFSTFARYVGVAIENAKIYKLTNDELAIAKRNSAMSFLVSAVAHEINNTFGLIAANVAGVRAQLETPTDNIKRRLALIDRVANQATEFANELAGFAAARRGEKRRLDLNELIRGAIDDLQELPRIKNSGSTRLEMALYHEPLISEIFENPFVQVVRNIVINAFQALEETQSGLITVSTLRSKGEMVSSAILRFQDNGPGILPEHKTKIFEPDFTTKPNGNGLGLWLVKTQLEQVGGTIEVESEPDEGATFVIAIPLIPEGEHPE